MDDWANEARENADRFRAAARGEFALLGVTPTEWSNAANVHYPTHAHPYRKVLHCVAGSITFHVGGTDHELHAGDRLDLAPLTDHGATVGPDGVVCLEAGLE